MEMRPYEKLSKRRTRLPPELLDKLDSSFSFFYLPQHFLFQDMIIHFKAEQGPAKRESYFLPLPPSFAQVCFKTYGFANESLLRRTPLELHKNNVTCHSSVYTLPVCHLVLSLRMDRVRFGQLFCRILLCLDLRLRPSSCRE